MSKSSRYDLLISLVQHDLTYTHVLSSSDDPVHNKMLYKMSMEGWIFLSDDLMCENLISEQARNTRITNLIKLINKTDASLFLNTLKKAYDYLIDHISGKHILTNYCDFKGRFSQDESSLCGFLFSPIKESLNAVIYSQTVIRSGCFSNNSTRDMKRCAQYLLFLSKINFKGVGLEESSLQDYLVFENETSNFDISGIEPYIPALQSIITNWLKDWEYDGFCSKHGSGSVADTNKDKVSKYLNFATDDLLYDLYHNDVEVVDSVLPFGSWCRKLDRTSQLVFVPKNITKLRSISMEPVTLQYLQQGCMNSLYTFFRTHKSLNKILKLEDQSQNKALAYQGSITNDIATIDLSHASDSVNWDLVKALFAGVPQLLRWLHATRSTHTMLPNGERLELSKYAPMGSALCFPIESLIFAAIAQLSIRLAREKALDRDNDTGIRSKYTYFSVYGDDIIIPSYAGDECISLLKLCGFTPNDTKSYLEGPFKESCGGNYFCGYDITAIKYAPSFDTNYKNNVSPEAYTALCSYANLAYERGYYLFRLYCIKLIFKAGLKPYFTNKLDEAPAIYSPTPTNFHLKKVYIKRYQKYQFIYTGVKTVEAKTKSSIKEHVDHIFLYDCLLSKQAELVESFDYTSQQLVPGGKLVKNTLVFDTIVPYSRSTLLPQVYMYTLCKKDLESF